ncbi:MAG TPA: hypothetical protein VJS69_09810 [Candidatus Krumholzibacteria bacterium]|nr:hypothetical protein [Candidatus Krumholzibacteria bacterium]
MSTNRECNALARYLVGRPCPADVADRYLRAVDELDLRLSPFGNVLWRASCGFRPLLACLDAGVALWHRDGNIRRRLLVMFALLETSPANADRFLFSTRSVPAHVGSVLRFLLAPLAMLIGTPLALLCRLGGKQQ